MLPTGNLIQQDVYKAYKHDGTTMAACSLLESDKKNTQDIVTKQPKTLVNFGTTIMKSSAKKENKNTSETVTITADKKLVKQNKKNID